MAPDLLTSERATEMVAACERNGTTVARLTAEAFASVAERDNPSGLGAVVRIPGRSLDDISLSEESIVVGLWETGNPGNLGTIVRTSDAAGAAGVIVAGPSADPWSPAAVKASLGTVFSTPVVSSSPDMLIDWARDRGLAIVATSAHGDVDLWSAGAPAPCLLLFGSEGAGLPPEALAAADVVLRIPQRGAATSLNLAVAAGIVIYEVARTIPNELVEVAGKRVGKDG